jgi:hypothetical protein
MRSEGHLHDAANPSRERQDPAVHTRAGANQCETLLFHLQTNTTEPQYQPVALPAHVTHEQVQVQPDV